MVDELIAGAVQLFVSEFWNPPWCWYRGHCGWSIFDALHQVTRELGAEFSDYIDAVYALNAAVGDVFVWEREPNRSQDDVVKLFRGVLDAA